MWKEMTRKINVQIIGYILNVKGPEILIKLINKHLINTISLSISLSLSLSLFTLPAKGTFITPSPNSISTLRTQAHVSAR